MYIKIISAIVGLAVVGGGVWYAAKGPVTPAVQQESTASTTVSVESTTVVATTTSESLSDVIAKGGNYICTFTMKDPNTESKGTVYISGKKFRGNFESSVKITGTHVTSHSISDGEYSYTWSSASPIGFKVPVIAAASQSGSGAMTGSMNFAAQGASTQYKCDPWNVDTSVFVAPTSIQFMEAPGVKK